MVSKTLKYKIIDASIILGAGSAGLARGLNLDPNPMYDVGAFLIPGVLRGMVTSHQKKDSLEKITEKSSKDFKSLTNPEKQLAYNIVDKSKGVLSGVWGSVLGAIAYTTGLGIGYFSR